MDYSTGKLGFIFLLAVLLSFVGAWLLATRYRAAMRKLMSAPLGLPTNPGVQTPLGAASPAPAPAERAGRGAAPLLSPLPAPAAVTARDNRRAGHRVALLLVALSALLAASSSALQLHVVMSEKAFGWHRFGALSFIQMWPVIPSLGLLWRWSRLRVLGALMLWFGASLALLLWRVENTPTSALLSYLAFEIGAPMLVAAAVCLGSATRAVAPWLLMPMVGVVWASLTGLDLIALMIPHPPAWFLALTSWLGAYTVMALFAVLPWLAAWWPLKWLGRALARAYTRKWLSELMVLFTAVWGISLLFKSLMAGSNLGLAGAVMMLPLAWVPVVMVLSGRRSTPRGLQAERPPTLLVLRVFQHDARVQALFDHVIERWRLTGNTVLIAGTDLLERTLDAEDVFAFIDGQLAARFIRTVADVAPRLAAFDLAADADGRHRINECYCHDSTWQAALTALVQRSDVVLMDLRSFQSRNAGCRHELGVLAQAPNISRVVLLADAETDRTAARAAIEGAPPGRFVWLDAARAGRSERREVLQRLFVAGEKVQDASGNPAAPGRVG